MHENGERWVTVSQAARLFRVSRNTVYEACREKALPSIRVGSLLRVRVNTAEEYLTVAEAGKLLGISTSTIYEACSGGCHKGQIPFIRIRSRIRIPRGTLVGLPALHHEETELIDERGQHSEPTDLVSLLRNNQLNALNGLM